MILIRGAGPALAAVLILCACRPATTRPYFGPVTGAPQREVQLEVRQATEILGGILKDDSFPLQRVEPRDGYIETAWLNAITRAATGVRPLGPDVVRVRIWIDPTREGYCRITAETVYRPLADASVDPRVLDRQVPPDHPMGKKMTEILDGVVKLYGPPTTPGAP